MEIKCRYLIECHYHFTNIHTEVFDSSVEKRKYDSVHYRHTNSNVSRVIPLVPSRSKIRIITPLEYAYRDE